MPIFYVLILLLTSFLWGGNFVYSKFLIGHASPMTLTILRWIIAIIVLLPMLIKKEKKLLPPKDSIFPLLLMGVTGVVFFNIFQFLALAGTSSINAGLISTLNPLSIAASSFLFLHEKINFRQLLAMLLSLFGVLIVLSKGAIGRVLALHFNAGDLWMVTAVIIWGIYSVCGKWVMKKVSPLKATFYSGVLGVIMLLPFNASTFQLTAINVPFILSLLYTGVVSTVVCMLLWNIGVQKVGATKSGIFLNFNPVFTAILAYFILHETLSWSEIAGSMIVIAGCYLFSSLEKPC
jgi:drug/metabolite transporter (DMT)-like permease